MGRICTVAVFVVAALGLGLRSSNAQAPARIQRDIQYVANGSRAQRLDLYLPAMTGTAPVPLAIWIHGGAWEAGSKTPCVTLPLVAKGYAAASIEYRFSQEAPFPAQIEDCKAAIRWLRAHAAEDHIDPNRIGVWGASAGGHLVALLGVTGTNRKFDVGANLRQSSAVQCVIDYFGPADFLHYGDPPATFDTPGNAVAKLFGGPISAHEDLARAASPVYEVSKTTAPFLIFQGDKDPLVPMQQSVELNDMLKKAGIPTTLNIIPGGGHGGAGFEGPAIRAQIVAFFDKYLGNR